MFACDICFAQCDNIDETVNTCSRECSQAQQLLETGTKILCGTRPTEDPRIFFFPQSFGRLCDLYSVMSIKRAHTRSIGAQQEMDYKLSKMKKTLTTLLGQLFFEEKQRELMRRLLIELFRTNAKMWLLKDMARNKRYDEATRKDSLYATLEKSDERHEIVKQLDILHSGKTTTYRVHNGVEN
jgi:hypothetical protein